MDERDRGPWGRREWVQSVCQPQGCLTRVARSVTWSETWTKCSPDGTQSRRYTVDVYPTRAGKQCPPPETRPCTYPGPETIMVDGSVGTWGTKDCAQRRKMLAAYTGESHESFTMSAMCQYAPLKVTVGDVVVFKVHAPVQHWCAGLRRTRMRPLRATETHWAQTCHDLAESLAERRRVYASVAVALCCVQFHGWRQRAACRCLVERHRAAVHHPPRGQGQAFVPGVVARRCLLHGPAHPHQVGASCSLCSTRACMHV